MLESGIRGFVQKPFSIGVLSRIIKEVLEVSQEMKPKTRLKNTDQGFG